MAGKRYICIFYDNVNSMKADPDLKENDLVETLGYDNPDDKKHFIYKIVKNENPFSDLKDNEIVLDNDALKATPLAFSNLEDTVSYLIKLAEDTNKKAVKLEELTQNYNTILETVESHTKQLDFINSGFPIPKVLHELYGYLPDDGLIFQLRFLTNGHKAISLVSSTKEITEENTTGVTISKDGCEVTVVIKIDETNKSWITPITMQLADMTSKSLWINDRCRLMYESSDSGNDLKIIIDDTYLPEVFYYM